MSSAFIILFALTAQAPAALNINTEAIQKSIVFLYGADNSGQADPQKQLGTGFMVRVPLTSDPKRYYILLATARHILDPQWARCASPNPAFIYGRFNMLSRPETPQQTTFIKIPLTDDAQTLWKHSSEDKADAAVVLIKSPDTALKDVEGGTIPISELPTDEETKAIGIGDQIVTAGLVPGLAGTSRNRPFFKFGFISSTSDEDIETRACPPPAASYNIRGWFLAANQVPGNSGSPIFFVPPGGPGIVFGSGVRRPVLLGIQSSSLIQADLAIMTQSSHLYEAIQLLRLPEADMQRGETGPRQPK